MFELKQKKGQALLEFALVFPIFMILVFGIMDTGWVLFKYLEFDYGYRNASWVMSISYSSDSPMTITGSTANNAIKSAVVSILPTIDKNNLSTSSSQIYCWTEKKTYYTPKIGGGKDTHIRSWRYARITSSLSYKVNLLTPVGQIFYGPDITITKSINKKRLLNTTE
jgi:Flp pilus assembly protein TadG